MPGSDVSVWSESDSSLTRGTDWTQDAAIHNNIIITVNIIPPLTRHVT